MKIRIWKLGSLEHKIIPNQQCIQKLVDIIEDRKFMQMDVNDIVWDSAINVEIVEVDDSTMNIVTQDFVLNKENVALIQNYVQYLGTADDPRNKTGEYNSEYLPRKCKCDMKTILSTGCSCGGV